MVIPWDMENEFMPPPMADSTSTQAGQVNSQRTFACLERIAVLLSHQLNTPLSISVTTTSTMQDSLATLRQKLLQGQMTKSQLIEVLDHLEDNLRMQQQATDKVVQHIAKIKQATTPSDSCVMQPIGAVMADTFTSYKTQLEAQNVCLSIDNHIPEQRVDGHAIHRVLSNLIDNSLEHAFVAAHPVLGKSHSKSPPKHPVHNALQHPGQTPNKKRQIDIRITQSQQQIILSYQDNGKGFTQQQFASVFEPFVTYSPLGTHLGLGIYELYTIVTQSLKGDIEVDNVRGGGLAFRIRFTVP